MHLSLKLVDPASWTNLIIGWQIKAKRSGMHTFFHTVFDPRQKYMEISI